VRTAAPIAQLGEFARIELRHSRRPVAGRRSALRDPIVVAKAARLANARDASDALPNRREVYAAVSRATGMASAAAV